MDLFKCLIAGGLIAGIVAIIKFLFPNYGLKRKMIIEINAEQAQEKLKAIKELIIIEQKANVIEKLELVHPELFKVKNKCFEDDTVIYMSILENRDSLTRFWDEINTFRKNKDIWLSRKVSAYLLYAEKYIMDFLKFLSYIEYEENDLYPWGLVISCDVQKWQRKLDEILIQELNNVSFEMESKSGDDWKYEQELLDVEYKKTVLYNLIHKTDEDAIKVLCLILVNYSINISDKKMNNVFARLIEEEYISEDIYTD